jgi:hypothetical protein
MVNYDLPILNGNVAALKPAVGDIVGAGIPLISV